MNIILTSAEMAAAAIIGTNRNIAAIQQGLPDANGHQGSGWNLHIEGACGEIALAKALNIYWSASINTFKNGGDVGSLQVRTRSRDDYDLIIRPNDNRQSKFILVTGVAPHFTIHGWITGIDARRDEWWHEHGGRPGAWFVPTKELKSLYHLKGEI